jgi:hypothetical protein
MELMIVDRINEVLEVEGQNPKMLIEVICLARELLISEEGQDRRMLEIL